MAGRYLSRLTRWDESGRRCSCKHLRSCAVTKRLSRVNANVDTGMATADEQIRVSDRVKEKLDRHRREGESYNDVLERLLERDAGVDFYDGFGMLSDEEADWIREKRAEANETQKERMRRLAGEES